MLQQLYQSKQTILKKSQEFFLNSSSLIPKIGCELEFFLFEKDLAIAANQAAVSDFISTIESELKKKFSLINKIEKEQGASQVEIKTAFTADLARLCDELENAKNFIKNFAQEKNLTASFASQPFTEDCGSALQFNISLHQNNENIFNSDWKILTNIADGLLKSTDSMMIFLAPKAEDYQRFSFEINRHLFKKGKFTAPINLSFGADNRSCAIRIPAIKKDEKEFQHGKRLEYRIAAADADLAISVSAILLAILSGIENQKSDFEQIFGNAFDEQYQLKNFCKNLKEAEENFFKEGNFIKRKMVEFLL